ncbi:MAG: hypothetical protein JNN04_12680 [Cyclobacteriaceae bacterium]|nr:hypothetical protein [Cyclobacteriaceae bacterium]
MAQNTKGDRPLGNQRQVKETKSKSFKRKEKSSTRDIAGRRLRTQGNSSANRANAQYRQPSTSRKRPERVEERPAPPRGRTFTRAPRESRVRAWKGDVSGYRMKRLRPTGQDAARSNVYPHKGPYVRYAQKRPKEKPPVYRRTIKGTRFVQHKPRAQERAWTGGLQHEPLRNQSATGTIKNTYSQRGPYVSYYKRKSKTGVKTYSNRSQVAKVQRYSKPPRTGGSQPRFFPSSRSKPYVQRGRKNVYWGKYQKKEKAVTTDLTGGPLRTRNYRSPVAGLVGRDSLQYFDRRPTDDRGQKGQVSGYRTATRRGNQSWKGDVAGWPVRSPRPYKDRTPKRLAAAEPGIGASSMSDIFNKRFRGVRPKDRVPRTPEYGYAGNLIAGRGFARAGAGYKGNLKAGRGFTRDGAGYQGNIRAGRGFGRGGAGYSGNLRRSKGFRGDYVGYSGNVRRSDLSQFSPSGFGYSGFMKRGDRPGFSPQGANYAGNQRRTRGFNTDYAGYSGNLKRSKGFGGDYVGYSGSMKRGAVGFSKQGAGYSGNLRRSRGFNTDYVGYSGRIKRGGRAFQAGGVGYSGFMAWGSGFTNQGEGSLGKNKRALARGFTNDGAGFSGTVKTKRPLKGGGTVSGVLWNNNESAIATNPPATSGGADFSGRTKAKRPLKGGGTVSGVLWNNNESAIARNPPATSGGADFSGRTKAKRPLKGGGTVSGVLWNNNESAIARNPPATSGGADFSGRTKAKRPLKGGGTVSGVLWNNNESALSKSPPATVGATEGLQVKVKEGNYSRKKNASPDALPGVAPAKATVKASEYSRNMKVYWNYRHNPSSSADARKVIAPGKAEARIRDYQGNVKMRKVSVSGMHPDAKFAHSEEDNVKEERSFLTNVKLFWEKMFNKSGNQPSSVKDKGKKLQYDKREKGLWAY